MRLRSGLHMKNVMAKLNTGCTGNDIYGHGMLNCLQLTGSIDASWVGTTRSSRNSNRAYDKKEKTNLTDFDLNRTENGHNGALELDTDNKKLRLNQVSIFIMLFIIIRLPFYYKRTN